MPAMTTLNLLQPGDEATIVRLEGPDEVVVRLMEMGLIEGTPLKVQKFAPMGDPMEIVLRGYHLTLRKAEAEGVIVEI